MDLSRVDWPLVAQHVVLAILVIASAVWRKSER
jgi:hypothetical protein